ncbi:hypothetical protein CEXT_38331, partial [Caerostris extrusa]
NEELQSWQTTSLCPEVSFVVREHTPPSLQPGLSTLDTAFLKINHKGKPRDKMCHMGGNEGFCQAKGWFLRVP